MSMMKLIVLSFALVSMTYTMEQTSQDPKDVGRTNWCTCNYPPVFAAASQGDYKGVVTLIKNGYPLHVSCKITNRTPLWIAAFYGCTSIVQELLNAGAAINDSDTYGWTPLIAAIINNRQGAFNLLINRCADVNKGSKTMRPLIAATMNHDPRMVRALMISGAMYDENEKVMLRVFFQDDPFLEAAVFDDFNKLAELWQTGIAKEDIQCIYICSSSRQCKHCFFSCA